MRKVKQKRRKVYKYNCIADLCRCGFCCCWCCSRAIFRETITICGQNTFWTVSATLLAAILDLQNIHVGCLSADEWKIKNEIKTGRYSPDPHQHCPSKSKSNSWLFRLKWKWLLYDPVSRICSRSAGIREAHIRFLNKDIEKVSLRIVLVDVLGNFSGQINGYSLSNYINGDCVLPLVPTIKFRLKGSYYHFCSLITVSILLLGKFFLATEAFGMLFVRSSTWMWTISNDLETKIKIRIYF